VKKINVERNVLNKNATVQKNRLRQQKASADLQRGARFSTSARLPTATGLKGLEAKKDKKNKSQVQSRLKQKSPWFSSISDPLHGADCKIPDETGVETGTLQIVQRVTVSSNSNGVAGVRCLCPWINSVNNGDPDGSNFQITTAAAAQTNIEWGNSAGTVGRCEPFEGAPEIKKITNAHRVVSAAIYVLPEMSLQNNSGEILLYQVPYEAQGSTGFPYVATYQNLYKSSILPVNSGKCGKSLWYPFQRQDWSFKSFLETDRTVFSDDDDNSTTVPNWEFGFIAVGLGANSTFDTQIVINLEYLPIYNTLNILDVSPSPQDAVETDLTLNWVQELPTSTPISFQQATSSPTTVEPQHGDEPTGLGMIADVIQTVLPFVTMLL
jgi:hypothetical protein